MWRSIVCISICYSSYMSSQSGKYTKYDRDLLAKGAKLAPRYIPINEDLCWMCGEDRPHTKEHVISNAIQDALSGAENVINIAHVDYRGTVLHKREEIPLRQYFFKGVCRQCNEGWMRNLETEMSKLIANNWIIESNEQAIVIARWVAKTASIINRSQLQRVKVPDEARHGLLRADHNLPPGWRIYAYRDKMADPIITFMQGITSYAIHDKETPKDMVIEAIDRLFCCAIKLSEIIFVAYYVPASVLDFSPVAEMRSLWPVYDDCRGEYPALPYGAQMICVVDFMGYPERVHEMISVGRATLE